MRLKHLICASASVTVITALAGSAQAQSQAGDSTTVGELVVTAQKREQRLQDVPVVVTVASGQQLEDAGVRDIRDLTVLTPGLIVTSTSNETSTSARIRGVGTVGDNPGLESSVGVVIDGVYRPRNGVGFNDLGELERIEVLKGPQGTLFGKNTSSGVINIVSARPSFNFGGEASVTYGNFDYTAANLSLTGPIVADKLAGRLYLGYGDRDGYQDVYRGTGPVLRPAEDNDQHFWTARGQLLWLPSSNLDLRLIADYTKREEMCCVGVQLFNGPFTSTVTNNPAIGGPNVLNPADIHQRLAFANRPTDQDIEDRGASLEINWDTPWLNGARLTSITGARRWNTENGQDSDFTSADLLYRNKDEFFRQFDQVSQELRLAGSTDRLNWLIGGFYAHEKLDSGESLNFGSQLGSYLDILLRTAAASPVASGGTGSLANPITTGGLAYILGTNPGVTAGPAQLDVHRQVSDSYAIFTNVDYKLTDKLTFTGGLRWTSEDKDRRSHYTNPGNGGCTPSVLAGAPAVRAAEGGPLTQRLFVGYFCAGGNDAAYNNLTQTESISEEKLTGTAKLSYNFTQDAMAYLSYARGYKSSGFNLYRQRCYYIPPALLGGADRGCAQNAANPAGALSPDPTTAFAPEMVDSYELGLKTTWFDRRLVVNAAIFYQKYEDYQLNAFDGVDFNVINVPEVTSEGVDLDILWQPPVEGLTIQGGLTYADTRYGDDPVPGSAFTLLPGSRISFAPLWSGSLSTTYEKEVAGLLWRFNVSGKYTGEYNTGSDLSPLKAQQDMLLVNARIGFGAPDRRWGLEFWAQNLTDEDYIQVAFDGTFQPNQVDAFLGAPRTYGVTLRSKF